MRICRKLAGLADLIFAPSVEDMYPPGDCTRVRVAGPAAVGLEDRFRPTHFEGVATVVAKLFNLAQPDMAIFGEKDYQQFRVIARMVQDLHMPVRIVARRRRMREPSGLAMSSRNRYLSAEDREHAAILHQTLRSCAEGIRAGDDLDEVMEAGFSVLSKANFQVDYFEARDAETLAPPADPTRPLRLLVAARLGTTRLIDNLAV